MKLQTKFFFCFLITSFLVLAMLMGTIQWFGARNFAEFAAETDLAQMDKIVQILKNHYRERSGWSWLDREARAWPRILDRGRPKGLGGQPPPLQGQPFLGPGNFRPAHPMPPPFDPIGVHNRLCLFDREKLHIAGPKNPGDRFVYRQITTDEGLVGFLGLKIPNQVKNPLGLAFLKRQAHALYLVGAGILILSALLSYILARNLLAPIHALTAWTRRVKSLDFDSRINVASNDELGGLARDFSNMARTLGRYEKLRRDWISDISHELRTPVSVLKGKIEAIQDGIRRPSQQMVDSLNKDVLRLELLIQDLHLLSLADSKNLAMDEAPVEPAGLLKETLAALDIRFERRQIKVETDLDSRSEGMILGNRELIRRVFTNLAVNSLRYTDPPGKLKVSHRVKSDHVEISFEDTPPGVPDKALGKIFNRLFRVDKSRSRALGGSGLGLSICRQILTHHDGRIEAAHSHLGGLMIRLTFPRTKNF